MPLLKTKKRYSWRELKIIGFKAFINFLSIKVLSCSSIRIWSLTNARSSEMIIFEIAHFKWLLSMPTYLIYSASGSNLFASLTGQNPRRIVLLKKELWEDIMHLPATRLHWECKSNASNVSNPFSQFIHNPLVLVRKRQTTSCAVLLIHPSCFSWRMIASIRGIPVFPWLKKINIKI